MDGRIRRYDPRGGNGVYTINHLIAIGGWLHTAGAGAGAGASASGRKESTA
jgi:hypothetical protein